MADHSSRLTKKLSLGAKLLASSVLLFGCQTPETSGGYEGAAQEASDPDASGVRQTGPNQYDVVITAFEGGFGPSEVRCQWGPR